MDRSLEHPRDSEETLLAAFAGILPAIPNAGGNRETIYLAKIQGQDVQLPETDRTRTEMYLRAIAEHGGIVPSGLTAENIKWGVTIGDIVGTCPCANLVTAPSTSTGAILVSGDFPMNGETAVLYGSMLYWNGNNWYGGGSVDDDIHPYKLPAIVSAYYTEGNFYIEVERAFYDNEWHYVGDRLTSHIYVYTFDGVIYG